MVDAKQSSSSTTEDSEDGRHPVSWMISEHAKPHLPYTVFGVIVMLVARLLWLYPVVVFGQVINGVLSESQSLTLPFIPASVIPEGQLAQLWFTAGVIGAAFFLGSLVMIVGSWARALASFRIQHDLRTKTYEIVQSHEMEFFDRERTGDLMSILNNDINQLQTFFSNTLNVAGNAFFIIIGVGFYMLVLNWQLALVIFITPVIIFAVNYYYSDILSPKYTALRQSVSDVNTIVKNNLAGMDIIKIYNQESREQQRIQDASAEYRDISWSVTKLRIIMGQITGRLTDIGYLLVFIVGGYWVIAGPPLFLSEPLQAGTLVTFFIFVRQFEWPMQQVTTIVDHFQETSAASQRVKRLHSTTVASKETTSGKELTNVEGHVSYSNVNFAYDDEPILNDVSFCVNPGETVGLVGLTGAGKSTLMKLLPRFYHPTSGHIKIDDQNISGINKESLRQHIGYVSQDPYIFEGTVKENIKYSDPDRAENDVEWAAKRAGAHSFITNLENSYQTDVGEEGSRLSGGQRQRLSLARAIYSDPEILILDEATSHIDNITESHIWKNLNNFLQDKTVIMIAHRISTIRDANRTLVLEDGRIIERGTHDQLVNKNGVYAALWSIQIGEFSNVSSSQYQQLTNQSLEAPTQND